MGRSKKARRTQCAKETLQLAKSQIDQASKAIRLLQEAQFKKLTPFLPAKEQVASQEEIHQAKEQLNQKIKRLGYR